MKQLLRTHGYYQASFSLRGEGKILRNNGERAFIIAQLQDLLSPRLILGDVPAYRQLASCIDLMTFSIQPDIVNLVFFSIDRTIAQDFIHRIVARLTQQQYEYRPDHSTPPPEFVIAMRPLDGPHHALATSIKLHCKHLDWEFDRYSSIGFFLHDRRGDWMRLWRLTELYDNDPQIYRELMAHSVERIPSSKVMPMQVPALPAS